LTVARDRGRRDGVPHVRSTVGAHDRRRGRRAPGDAIGIQAFSGTDTSEPLESIDVPTVIAHGDGDQIEPIVAAAGKSDADLLAFLAT